MNFPKLLATNTSFHELWVVAEACDERSRLGPLVNIKYPNGSWRLREPVPLFQYLKIDADWRPVDDEQVSQ